MKQSKKLIARLFMGVTAIALLAQTPVSAWHHNHEQNAAPDSQLQRDVNAIRDIGTVGVLAVTTDDNKITRARAGTAIRGTSLPVPWESHFRIGSNTKTFIATVLLQLETEGKLSLDDSVEKWLPGAVEGNGNNGELVTIRNLLQHTSGLFDYTSDETFWSTVETPRAFYKNRFTNYSPDQLVAVAMRHAPNFAPGTDWEYSNTNYILAGMVIEAVSGRSWVKEAKERIIRPLHLTDTVEPGTKPYLPWPHMRGYQLFDTTGVYTDTTLHNMTWGGAAGSLVSTPQDITRFFKALMAGKLLSPAQLAKMQTVVEMGPEYEEIWPGVRYGLGIMRFDLPCGGVYWGHGGDVIGYNNTNGVTPDGKRSAVVASSTNTFSDPIFAENSIRTTDTLVKNALCNEEVSETDALTASGREALAVKQRL
ncbi:MAG TPA: serine hydrolase domain-containing protein [Verrucomicrobiae bacterium]|nr:serine hydrolase domain-containing protein [Verrucomicrobiae bacterium]